MTKKVLVVGATGYLGQFLIKALKKQGYWVRVLTRNKEKIAPLKTYIDDVHLGEATQPESLTDLCQDIDIVISSLGITKQKEGLTYMEVDYQANRNILNEALSNQVTHFMYISVFNAQALRHLAIVKAKEKFVQTLIKADIQHSIIRPNGFFSDMSEYFKMAQKGRVYLFGDGQYRANPIHGADLAQACVAYLDSNGGEFEIGGPEILTHKEIASQAFEVLNKPEKITYLPDFIKNIIIKFAKTFTSVKTYGPIEFFMTVLTMDMIAPTYGQHTLKAHFKAMSEIN
jgi:uncharacterized protein YbjT (DUF2867 family)